MKGRGGKDLCLYEEIGEPLFSLWKSQHSDTYPYGAMNFIPELAIHFWIANSLWGGAVAVKGSHKMDGYGDFSENLRASLFNKDLSDEPNFRRIHLAGQYL